MCGIIGPYFFEDSDGHSVTVNANRYMDMLQSFLIPELRARQLDNIWFQQDGATAHTARATMTLLRELFPNRLISRFGDLTFPSRSPDLTAPDYFLWGYLKERIFSRRLHSIDELKMAIRREIRAIPQAMVRRVMNSFPRRLH